jgi:hypothetical protein
MAKARKATRKRKAGRRRKKVGGAALQDKVKKAVAELQKTFQVAKIVGSAKDGKLELKTDCDDIEIKFISLNAPFKTKALVSAP